MKKLAIALLISLPMMTQAADIEAGKAKAAMCAGCHGTTGVAPMKQYPNLKGQNAAYTILQLKAFKSGARKNAVMAPMAGMLSDADMENIAAYYESLGN